VTRDGLDRAHLTAPYLARFETQDSTYALLQADPDRPDSSGARAVHVDLFDDQGEPSAVVDAQRLVYQDEQQRFVAQGRVLVVTVEGRRLESEEVRWDEASRELRADGFVRITAPDEAFEGYGLVAAEDLSTYELARVTGQAEVEDWE
jgi:lipopolysaccharide assembly outer membrane protein LptD (OstA)